MKGNESYRKIYSFLDKRSDPPQSFTVEDLSDSTGLKVSTCKVYIRNKLKDIFIDVSDSPSLFPIPKIKEYSEEEFVRLMSQKNTQEDEEHELYHHLISNSIQAMISVVELHNKPQIQYRYQIVVILIINSW